MFVLTGQALYQGYQLFLILQKTSWFSGNINQSGYTNLTIFLILENFCPLNYMWYKKSSWLVKRIFLIARCLCWQLCLYTPTCTQCWNVHRGLCTNHTEASYTFVFIFFPRRPSPLRFYLVLECPSRSLFHQWKNHTCLVAFWEEMKCMLVSWKKWKEHSNYSKGGIVTTSKRTKQGERQLCFWWSPGVYWYPERNGKSTAITATEG